MLKAHQNIDDPFYCVFLKGQGNYVLIVPNCSMSYAACEQKQNPVCQKIPTCNTKSGRNPQCAPVQFSTMYPHKVDVIGIQNKYLNCYYYC